MTGARETVLARIRAALVDGAVVEPVERRHRRTGSATHEEVVARFRDRVEEYGGVVVETGDPAGAARDLVQGRTIGVPSDLPSRLRPSGVVLVEDAGLAPRELDALDGALTCCAAACADTGTIALAGGVGEGRRALTLVPDLHVCVVRRDQIVETVPELFALLEPAARDGRPIVLVSGPSATSDIEFDRVEGVHGPALARPPPHRREGRGTRLVDCARRGVAQPGSALALGARSRRFESGRPDLSRKAGIRGSGSRPRGDPRIRLAPDAGQIPEAGGNRGSPLRPPPRVSRATPAPSVRSGRGL